MILTRGQLRRRWWIATLTLFASLPWWMWVAAPLIKDGKPLVRSGVPLVGTCADCCPGGGGGCSGCASSLSCANCALGAAGDTPTQYTITASSIALNQGICCTGNIQAHQNLSLATLAGTFTLAQVATSVCVWRYTNASYFTVDRGTCPGGGGFTVSSTPSAKLTIQLTRLNSTDFLMESFYTITGDVFNYLLFHQTISVATDADCCAELDFTTNDYSTYQCTGVPSRDGINGSIIATPC